MYGLPEDFDATFLVGCSLDQLCVSVNTVSFVFDHQVRITVEGDYAYQDAVGLHRTPERVSAPALAHDVKQLIGRSIVQAHGARDGTLSLLFEDGQKLIVLDTPHYESYQILNGDKETIV